MYPSLRDDTALSAGFATVRQAADACGIHAVEIDLNREMQVRAMASDEKFLLDSDAAVAAYGDHLKEYGIKPAGFLLASNFNAEDLDAEIEWVVRATEAAAALGMHAIRIDSIMKGEADMTTARRVERFVDALGRVLDRTRDLQTGLGIENHGAGGNNREFLDGVFAGVGSDRVGMTMDMGNFYWSGLALSEVYDTLEHFAPRTKHTHVKNINYPESERNKQRPLGWEYGRYCCPLADGDIDLGRVIGYLREVDYEGDLSLEDESIGKFPPDERQRVLIDDAQHLKSLL